METIARTLDAVRRHGLRGFLRRGASFALARAWVDSEHVWYSLDLGGPLGGRQLPEGLRLVRGGLDALELLARLPTVSRAVAERWSAGGAEPWLVLDGGAPAFACWIFRGRIPLPVAPRGLPISPDAAVLEESVTAPAYRGRGIAPAAWSTLAQALRDEGLERLLTLVPIENAASRRAVEKAGFVEFARVFRSRLGPLERVTARGDGPAAAELRAALGLAAPSYVLKPGTVPD